MPDSRLSAAAAVTTVVGILAAALLPAVAAHADPIGPPVCPQPSAVQGIPITTVPALSSPDLNAVVSISAGALPTGVQLVGDRDRGVPYAFSGTPAAPGSSTFTVTRYFEDASPESTTCSIVVAAAPEVARIQGLDRYQQAAKVSAASFTDTDTVYLASGEKFPDALSAASVAGTNEAPLLLTAPAGPTAATLAELKRLTPSDIVIVGGAAAVPEPVLAAIRAEFPSATVTRIGGADRFEVSRALITNAEFGVPNASSLYLASGAQFPDALAASPAAVHVDAPVLLVDGSRAAASPAELKLMADLGVTQVTIAGGTASISAAFQTALAKSLVVHRASGADRFETAVAVNAVFDEADTVYLASGLAFPDALSAAPVAGRDDDPVYLVHQDCVPESVLREIVRLTPEHVVVLGGPAALAPSVDTLRAC